MNFKVAIVFLQMLTTSYGDFELACDPVNPSVQTDVTCVCRRTVGSGIKWFFNGNFISDCILNSFCLPQPIDYTFSINTSEFEYEMTKSAYDYNDCTQINCTDASNTNVQLMVVPSAINFDQSNPPTISEPALSHNNGNISISTGCISGYTDVTCEWFTVYNLGKPEEYTDGQFAFNENDKSACSNCNNDVNAKRKCGFYHIEASGNETRNVNFRVVVTHTPTNLKWEVNSANVYTVKVNKPSESDRPSDYTLYIVLGILGVFVIVLISTVVVVGCRTRPKFSKIELDETEIHFDWTTRQNCCYQKCYIDCKPKQRQLTENSFRQTFTKDTHFTLVNLDQMAIYEISLSRKLLWCFARKRSVITRKHGMPNDQGYQAMPTSIDVWWTKPDCISNPQLKYQVTCNEQVKEETTDRTKSTITGLMPTETYKIEVLAIDKRTNSLLVAEEIKTTPLQVCLGDFCYKPGQSCVECNITWTVKDFDIQEHLNDSENFYFIIKWCIGVQEVDKRKKIRASRYTIPKLYPEHSYTVYVYPVYHSVTFTHDMIELTTPYIPTWDPETTSKAREIELKWKKPKYTGDQPLEYEVICDEKKVETSETSCKIENLKPLQSYNIRIFTIINKNGMKSLPLQREISTQPGHPDPPEDFTFPPMGVMDTSITIEWKEGSNGGRKQTFYVKLNGNEQKVNSACKHGDIWSYTWKKLKPGTAYDIEIKAKNCMGSSEPCHLKVSTTNDFYLANTPGEALAGEDVEVAGN